LNKLSLEASMRGGTNKTPLLLTKQGKKLAGAGIHFLSINQNI